ncbi:40S ribosomal protein S5-1 [Hordeum vulgare]|nr:40S ribosomal protein S5-1 [Hordeum vulgare]
MIFEKVINPYLTEVLKHPQSIKMSEGMLHIRDVEGPKKTRSMETRLEAMEQQVFKCQGMVERGLNANHMMITEFTSNHKMDAIDIGKHLSRLYDRVDQLQGQIYDLQNQNCEYEYRFESISADHQLDPAIAALVVERRYVATSSRRQRELQVTASWSPP